MTNRGARGSRLRPYNSIVIIIYAEISGRKRMIPFSRPLPHFLQHSGTCHEVGHVWHPSCIYCFLEVFYYVYVGALKLYGPLYLVKCNILRAGLTRKENNLGHTKALGHDISVVPRGIVISMIL